MEIPINRHDVIVGFFVLSGFVTIAVLTLFLAGSDLFDTNTIQVKTLLSSTFGLARGTPVTFLDMKVGRVKSVQLTHNPDPEKRVEVVFTVKEEFRSYIRKNFKTTLKKQMFGGFISGEITLKPPPPDKKIEGSEPVEEGDYLRYAASSSILDGLDDLPTRINEELLPMTLNLIAEINRFMEQINDPDGNFQVTFSSLRNTAEYLTDPEGELKTTLALARQVAARLADERNVLMTLLGNEELARTITDTVGNVREISERGVVLTEKAERTLDSAEAASSSGQALLAEAAPKVARILENLIVLQNEVFALVREAQVIAAALVESSDTLPGLVRDAEVQMKELEDITRAVKNPN